MGTVRIHPLEGSSQSGWPQFELEKRGGLLDIGQSALQTLGMTARSTGTLTFTPDGEEPEEASEERLVEIHVDPRGDQLRGIRVYEPGIPEPWSFNLSDEGTRTLLGSPAWGRKYTATIRRIPDAPEGVQPWRIRPNASMPHLVCGYCQWPVDEGSEKCAECGKRLGEPRDLPGTEASDG